jgi:hypothetical protein
MVWNDIWEAALSWKAKGVLGYIVGKPEGWKVRVADLVSRSHGNDGETSIRSALIELRMAGYAVLEYVTGPGGALNGSVLKVSDSPVFYDRAENAALRGKISRDSGNPKLGKPGTRETRDSGNRYLSNTDVVAKRSCYQEADDSSSRGEASSPPLLPRGRAGGSLSTSSTRAPADAGEDDPFELSEKGEALKKQWDAYYEIIFKRPAIHKEDDLIGLERLAQEGTLKEMMGFILTTWSFKRKNEGFDPHFYCARYSSRPRDMVIVACKDGINNLEKMRSEISWRGTKPQIEFGYKWFEDMKNRMAVQSGS